MLDRCILVVDDSADDRFLVERALKKAQIANPVRLLDGGEEAIAYLEGRGQYADRLKFPLPAIVLLDLKMPRMSGFEVLQWVRASSDYRRLPVVVMTSSREMPDVNRAYDVGANSYLVKPPSFDALVEMVKSLHLYWYVHSERPEIGDAVGTHPKEPSE
jgi:CheY-like chemotaxis protein